MAHAGGFVAALVEFAHGRVNDVVAGVSGASAVGGSLDIYRWVHTPHSSKENHISIAPQTQRPALLLDTALTRPTGQSLIRPHFAVYACRLCPTTPDEPLVSRMAWQITAARSSSCAIFWHLVSPKKNNSPTCARCSPMIWPPPDWAFPSPTSHLAAATARLPSPRKCAMDT